TNTGSNRSSLLSVSSILYFVVASHPGILAGKNLGLGDLVLRQRSSGGDSDNIVILIDEFEVVAREKVRDGGELGSVASGVVVQLKQRHGEELHVLGNRKDLCWG